MCGTLAEGMLSCQPLIHHGDMTQPQDMSEINMTLHLTSSEYDNKSMYNSASAAKQGIKSIA